MSDIFDDASDAEELHRQMAIKKVRDRQLIKTTGFCLSCNARLADRRFCDVWCREDYERMQNICRIRGSK